MKKKLNQKLKLNKTDIVILSKNNRADIKGGDASNGCAPTVSLVVICITTRCPISYLSNCQICEPTGTKFC